MISLVRVVSNRIVFVDQRVNGAGFSEKVDGVFNMIVAVNNFHVALFH
jgi:hypothetical protein